MLSFLPNNYASACRPHGRIRSLYFVCWCAHLLRELSVLLSLLYQDLPSRYQFFATSKDVTIGVRAFPSVRLLVVVTLWPIQPVAVMSILIGEIVNHIEKAHGKIYSRPQIATTLSFICGFITVGIGVLRIGWIVEFISLPAVSGFMTGSAITIVAGQVPSLMGITGFEYVLYTLQSSVG
jgi:MFS superfamily sulfate permease-like transporter